MNKYKNWSSKTSRIYIPLENFQYLHRPSDSNDDVDPAFIGRDEERKTLKEWLKSTKVNQGTNKTDVNYSGSYLITGYRGMGKSSFVGAVINSLLSDDKERLKFKEYYNRLELIFICAILFLCIVSCYNCEFSLHNIPSFITKLSTYILSSFSVYAIILYIIYGVNHYHSEKKSIYSGLPSHNICKSAPYN